MCGVVEYCDKVYVKTNLKWVNVVSCKDHVLKSNSVSYFLMMADFVVLFIYYM